jgi:hypothetical protein
MGRERFLATVLDILAIAVQIANPRFDRISIFAIAR